MNSPVDAALTDLPGRRRRAALARRLPFLRRRAGLIEAEPIVLHHRRVYIFVSAHGLTFAAALLLMLSGSINYALGLGFALTFALVGMSIAGLFFTFRNFVNLSVSTARTTPVFAGDNAAIALLISNPTPRERFTIRAIRAGANAEVDVPHSAVATLTLQVPTEHRGWLHLGRVTLESRYPLGLFRAWSYVHPDVRVLVYPRPDSASLPPETPVCELGKGPEFGTGSDDFAGLRAYQQGDSPRHIAWRIAARTDTLITKQFSEQRAAELVLDWDALPVAMDIEARLSRLTGWVLQAEAEHRIYRLRLPRQEIGAGRGLEHRDNCLKALALFDLPGGEPAR